jgi:hypothetical protein
MANLGPDLIRIDPERFESRTDLNTSALDCL